MSSAAAPSPPDFTRGRLLVGVVVFTAIGAGLLFLLARSLHPSPGVVLYRDHGRVRSVTLSGAPVAAGRLPAQDAAVHVTSALDAVASAGQMRVVNVRSGRIVATVEGAIPLAASPDGRELLYAVLPPSERPRLMLLESKDWSRKETGILGEFRKARVGPLGQIAVIGHRGDDPSGSAYLLSPGLSIRRIATRPEVMIDSIAWLASGLGLAATYRDADGEHVGVLGLDGRLRMLARSADPDAVAVVRR